MQCSGLCEMFCEELSPVPTGCSLSLRIAGMPGQGSYVAHYVVILIAIPVQVSLAAALTVT